MKYLLILLSLISATVSAQPLPDYTFKSPAFNGSGYSSHELTIENLEHTRKEQIRKDMEGAIEKAKNDKNNTNLAKFLNNLESRIYAQISQNIATAMFADSTQTHGSLDFEGSTISWTKNGTESISLTVIDPTGSSTVVTIPLGQFIFQ